MKSFSYRTGRAPRKLAPLWSALAILTFLLVAGASACGSSGGGGGFNNGSHSGGDGGGATDGSGPGLIPVLLDGSAGDAAQLLTITPATVTLSVTLGTTPSIPTQQFTALYGGGAVPAQYTIDKGQIGTIGVATGLFTPASLGGTATVTATYQGVHRDGVRRREDPLRRQTAIRTRLTRARAARWLRRRRRSGRRRSGATPTQIASSTGSPTADPDVTFLYPYNNTVFPQAILPPLLQWTIASSAAELHVRRRSTSTSPRPTTSTKGYFAAPTSPGLDGGPGGPFQNHPVPQAAWNALAYSNVGEPVNVPLIFAEGTQASGPVTRVVALRARRAEGDHLLQLVRDEPRLELVGRARTPTPNFGGATLAIKEGQTSPVLVAGTSVTSPSGCRVCHSVAAGGSTLITQQGEQPNTGDGTSSAYALTAGQHRDRPREQQQHRDPRVAGAVPGRHVPLLELRQPLGGEHESGERALLDDRRIVDRRRPG